jgi:septal ring factor EnvC (AmiA/AmiB activator)
MDGEILLEEKTEPDSPSEAQEFFASLEEKVNLLLLEYREARKTREDLVVALKREKERADRLERKLELISEDRDKVKTRIDQLLHRLKGFDL